MVPQGYAQPPQGYYFAPPPAYFVAAPGYAPQAPQAPQQAVPPQEALEALRAEFTRAVQLVRVDSGEVLLPCELLGDPRNNDQVEFRARVEFSAPFIAPPVVRLAVSSIYADGSGDHGAPPNINGNLDRLLCMLNALDVSERGFTLRVATWHRGHLRPNSRFLWFASASPAWAAAPPDLGAAAQRAAAPRSLSEAPEIAKQCAVA